MIIFLAIVGYIIAGVLNVHLAKNVAINKAYREELESYKTYNNYSGNEVHYAEESLKEATRSVNYDLPLIQVFGFAFWPCYLIGLGVYGIAINFPKITMMKSKAEREVNKLKSDVEAENQRKLEWKNAIKMLEDSGIDTSELKKMKIN